MRRSEERFRLLVENVPEYAIFMLDPNGRVSTWNGGAQRIKGSTAEEIIGKHFSIFYPQDAKEGGWTDHELQVATEEGRFVDTGWRVRKDGTTFWAHVIITALRDARAAHAVQRNLGWTQVLLRGESPKGPEAGLGLGLAICKQLVEQHGGSIRAASQGEDKGATFSVVLPVSIAQLQEEGTPRIRSRRRLASSSLRKSGRHAPPTIREGKPSPFLAVPTGTSMSTISNRVLRSLRERAPGAGLTRDFYTDAEIFALDLEEIFYQDWLFVAHSTELPDAGSYLTLQVGEYPIVLTRTADGVVRAFINSCRHRGARVCPEAAGKAAKLVCPYHQWTYNLDGRLFAARQMGPGFDRSQLGLKPVCCETVAGYIFVCLAAEAPDFGPTRRQLEPYLLPHRLSEARVAFRSTLIEEGNWKLVWENNRECYHCAANHPELARTFSDRPTVTSVSGAEDDPLIAEHWRRCESAALASQFQLSPDGQMRTARMPLVGPAVSYTLTGHAAVKRPLSDSIPSNLNIGALLLFHYPTTWNHGLADHAVSFRVLPLGPTRTELTTKWLVHRNAVEGVDYDLNELTQVWLATNEQDRRIVREIQIGMSCPAYEPGPLSNVTEGGVKQFIDWYCTRLEQRLSPDALRKVC